MRTRAPAARNRSLVVRSCGSLLFASALLCTSLARAQPAAPTEREVTLPEAGGVRLSGFFIGSGNYNSRIQMVPEFAGSAPVTSEPGRVDFRFDQFSIGAFKTFGSWLSAGASIEVERHAHRHTHGFDPDFGCPGAGSCVERFGTEPIATEVSLHRFSVTGVVPVGNGISLSVGRFDTPFGYERHDAALNLTATISEVQRFGRPQSMTGAQAFAQLTQWLDAVAWLVNRWENETTEDPPEDNNRAKSVGGRIGFTPLQGATLLNLGIGGFWGPERDDDNGHSRWILDADLTWSLTSRLILAAELVHGAESAVSFRRRGSPIPAPAVSGADVTWNALYALAHHEITDWLGFSARYGLFQDADGARTGVAQVLQSFTLVPIVHLSRLVPGLRPLGVTYARTRHPIDWVDLRLEYRLAHSNQPVFADVESGIPITAASRNAHQITLQVIANY
jgi:hypothetical protein